MHSASTIPSAAGRPGALLREAAPDALPEIAFDELAALAAQICATPIALITLLESEHAFVKAHHGLAAADVPHALAFCTQVAGDAAEPPVVPDTSRDGRFATLPFVTGAPGARSYAGVTLRTAEGHAAGTLCVIDLVPRTLTHDQTAALGALGRQVVAQLELHCGLAAALRNHRRLANSQRIAGLGDWDYDFANHQLAWSDEVYRILGLERAACPPDSEAFYRLVHPDDLAFVRREKQVAATGLRRVDFEHRIIRPDGEVRSLRQVAELLFDEAGGPVREAGTIQDITGRKLAEAALRDSEARFKFVARAVSDVVWDWDLRADTVWWNDGFFATFGFKAGEISPGLEFRNSRLHAEDRRRVVDGLAHALASGAEKWKYDPGVKRDQEYSEVTSRGVAAWMDSKAAAGAACRSRIFMGTIDARLIALDGATGKPCFDFGSAGQVDLTRDVGLRDRGDYQVTSP
ncbi:MAG: PAS domain-containing protein, partial [Opitutae bacterium]|nr:PAS domain-containing protein [Opitutae bacterium]